MKPVLALVGLVALACACGPGAGEPARTGSTRTDGRSEHAAASTDARTTSGSSSSADRTRGHVGNGKR